MNFKLNLILLLVLLNGGSLLALPFSITGNATNNGLPAISKEIFVQATGADTSVFTDASGNFNLLINPSDSSGTMRVFFLDCANDTTDSVVVFDMNTRNVTVSLKGCISVPINKHFGVIKMDSFPINGADAILLRYKYLAQTKKFQFEDTIPITTAGEFNFLKDSLSDYLLKVIPKKDTSRFAATYYPNGITWDANYAKAVGPYINDSLKIDVFSYRKPRGGFSVEGTIEIDASLKLAGYSAVGIHLLDLRNNLVEFIYANDSGLFKFSNIDSGDYKIWIDQCGLPTEPKLISLRGANTQITGIVLTASENGISFDKFVSLSESTATDEISIYPNPFYNFINIEVPINSSIIIHDLVGRPIFQKNTNDNEVQRLETESWQPGIYIITLESEGEIYQRKLIKR